MNSHHPAAVQTPSNTTDGKYEIDLAAVADAMLRRCLWIPVPATAAPAPHDGRRHEPPQPSTVVMLRRPAHVAPPRSAAA